MYTHLGAHGKAKQSANEAISDAVIFPPFHAYALVVSARYYIREGNFIEADKLLRKRAEIQEHNKTIFELEIVMALVEIEFALANGDQAGAMAQMDALLGLLDRSGARYFLPETLSLKANIMLAQNQIDEAQSVLLKARAAAQQIGSRTHLWRILASLARLTESHGDHESARQYREEALPVIEFIAAHTSDAELRESFFRLVESEGIQLNFEQMRSAK
jgi:tetratricopeptide (TPR) repeat protein